MSVLIKSRRNRPVLLLIRRHLNDLDYIQVYAYCFEQQLDSRRCVARPKGKGRYKMGGHFDGDLRATPRR